MGEVAKHGRTVLFVSHNMIAIRTLCSRAVLLKQGNVVANDNAISIVSKYMEETRDNAYSRDWPDEKSAPQNESAILNAIAVCDDNGKTTNKLYSDVPFNIEIDYKVKSDYTSVGFSLIFYDNENNCIMASINNHEKNFYAKLMKAGYYKSICKIPKNLLNNGKFSLSLIIFAKNYSDSVTIKEMLNIEIHDGAEVRGDYFGVYACRIRPLFDWITNKKGDRL
jgi:lipopolysaccharide transport system ATP-binding protein